MPQDYMLAAKWYAKSAEQGYAVAQYALALCYEDGKGLPHDHKQAVMWHSRAEEQGDEKVAIWTVMRNTGAVLRGRKVTKDLIDEILTVNMPVIANTTKKKYNLIDIKHGFNHVASSGEDFVKNISSALGLDINNLSGNDLNYLCWIAVPIDESDYVIKEDSQEQLDKFRSNPDSGIINSPRGDQARFEYMLSQTEIDEVVDVLGKIARSRVFPGMYAIMDNGVKYRRLSYLTHP